MALFHFMELYWSSSPFIFTADRCFITTLSLPPLPTRGWLTYLFGKIVIDDEGMLAVIPEEFSHGTSRVGGPGTVGEQHQMQWQKQWWCTSAHLSSTKYIDSIRLIRWVTNYAFKFSTLFKNTYGGFIRILRDFIVARSNKSFMVVWGNFFSIFET